MVERDFAPRARMSVQIKDLRNALATAKEVGFDAPITALFEQLYREGIEHGLADLDHSGLFVELASRNGMA
jgi:3-hydroxyisobutyrate dehydrogenase-like beta-hydroxyacid dehydrogenase